MSVSTADLATYLGTDVVTARAQMMIDHATLLCESVVNPLPAAASAIVLSAAARAYANPQGVTAEGVGPYHVQRPWAGVYLTKSERTALRRMMASSGAFSIDPTPADAGPHLIYPQVPLDPGDLWTNPPYYGDWDWPATS